MKNESKQDSRFNRPELEDYELIGVYENKLNNFVIGNFILKSDGDLKSQNKYLYFVDEESGKGGFIEGPIADNLVSSCEKVWSMV